MNKTKNLLQEQEIVGILNNVYALEPTIQNLLNVGFQDDQIDMLSPKEVEQSLEKKHKKLKDLTDSDVVEKVSVNFRNDVKEKMLQSFGKCMYLGGFITTFVGLLFGVEKLGLMSVAIIVNIIIMTSIIAALLNKKYYDDYIREQMRNGGLILWVKIRNPEQKNRAIETLSKHNAFNIHAHAVY